MTSADCMRPIVASVLGSVALLALSACRPDVDKIVNVWLSCIECRGQQRRNLAAVGDRAVPTLGSILQFPAPRREAARRMIAESYQPVPNLTREQYIELMVPAYIARAQVRAIISLGDIATPAAVTELRSALSQAEARAYGEDVVRALRVALARATNDAFSGTLGATAVAFGDTVRVHAAGIAWDGDESVELHGSPFATEVFLNRYDTPGTDDSLEFVAVGEIGKYSVVITKLGTSDLTQVDTTLRIRSLRYQAHTAATSDVLTEASLPQTRYLVLGSAGGLDTIDYVRVSPSGAGTFTATARWPGGGSVHLAWRDCVGGALPALGTVSGSILDRGTPLDGARVNVFGTNLFAVTSNGDFSIVGVPPLAYPHGMVTLVVRRIGYQSRSFIVPINTSGHRFNLSLESSTPATTMNMTSSPASIPAGACRLLQVWQPLHTPHQIVQLRITQ